MLSNEELIKGCKAGKEKYYQALYQQYKGLLFGVCLRYLRDKDDAQDVLQESFINIFRKLNSLRESEKLVGWMKRICVNQALTFIRNKKSVLFSLDDENFYEEPSSNLVEIELNTKQLYKYISALPDGYRMIFNLYYIEGYSHKEISEKLGITISTSTSQITRAKKYLQNLISRTEKVAIR